MSFPDVIIVGAGISGITAASELTKAGLDVVVMEGRNRVGGRLFTDRKSGSKPYELGCSWFHESLDNPLLQLALDNNIEVAYDDNTAVYDLNGPVDPNLQLGQVMGDFNAFARLNNADNGQTSLKSLAEAFIKSHPMLNDAQKRALPDFLRFMSMGKGLDWSEVSGEIALGGGNGRDLVVLGGYDRIFDVIKGPVSDQKILLGTAVDLIDDSDPDYVSVKTVSGDVYRTSYVVVTAPIGVLKSGRISFKPELSQNLNQAIQAMPVAEVGKVYLEFDEVFWPEDTDKIIFTANQDGYPLFFVNWYLYNGEKKYPGLLVLMGYPLARKLEGNKDSAFEYLKPALEALRTDKLRAIPQPTKVTVSQWTVDEFSNGSYSTFAVGHDRARAVAAFEKGASSRVMFAGEHTILRGGTFAHGAYRSGLRAANKVLHEHN
jgi:polyamine oxidase